MLLPFSLELLARLLPPCVMTVGSTSGFSSLRFGSLSCETSSGSGRLRVLGGVQGPPAIIALRKLAVAVCKRGAVTGLPVPAASDQTQSLSQLGVVQLA